MKLPARTLESNRSLYMNDASPRLALHCYVPGWYLDLRKSEGPYSHVDLCAWVMHSCPILVLCCKGFRYDVYVHAGLAALICHDFELAASSQQVLGECIQA